MAEPHPSEGSSTSIDVSAERSDSTVELNIKTLDSRMFSFSVDKNIPVSVFKEMIASTIGVPVEQQRLIFRGKVLKDSHLLSEYHVDNGHTLHLVARQPSQPQSSSSTNSSGTTTGNRGQDANAGVPRFRGGQVSHSVLLGTFNGGEQGDGSVPDLNQVIGAVLNSLGIGNPTGGNGSVSAQPTMQANPPAHASQGNEAEVRQATAGDQVQGGNQSPFGQTFAGQTTPQVTQIPLGTAIPIPSLIQPMPDSLHTLSEFMNRMELSLSQPSGNQLNQSSNETGNIPPVELPANSRGVPTPEALVVVLRHAQRLLGGQAINALSRIAGRIEQEGGSADATVRAQIQAESMQVGIVMQQLGSLLLELGRTMLALRMGLTSAESSVNSGPAVYISPSGPNPLMVQPFPLQTSSLLGGSGVPPLNRGTFVPGVVGPIPRHVNIHIHTAGGPRTTNAEGMQGDRGNATGPGNSGQTRVLPARNIISAAAPSRHSVVSVPVVVTVPQPGGSLSQPPSTSVPLSTVSELNSQIRNMVDNMRNENQGVSAHPESSAVQGQPAVPGAGNGDGTNDINLLSSDRETCSASPYRASETQNLLAQAETKPCHKEDTEGAVNPGTPSSSSVEVVHNQSSGETLQKPVDGVACASSSNPRPDNPEGVQTVPLGLGLGGLQPKRRSRQSDLRGTCGDGVTPSSPNQNQRVRSHRPADRRNSSTVASGQLVNRGVENMQMEGLGAGDQVDPANVMSQVIQSPAMDGLLAGVSQQTGVGSPDVLRNMLGQLTQNPAMMNTVNQIAQQIDSQDFGSMFAGLGSGRSGGFDLSRMIGQMMPIVSQALGGASTIPQQGPSVEREVHATYNEIRPNSDENPNDQNSQVDLQHVVQSLEHGDPPKDVLRAVVENVISSHGYGSDAEALVNELCAEDGLASDFMEMLHRDISRRVEDETGSAEKP